MECIAVVILAAICTLFGGVVIGLCFRSEKCAAVAAMKAVSGIFAAADVADAVIGICLRFFGFYFRFIFFFPNIAR